MKRRFILSILICFTTLVNGQDIYHAACYPQYDSETGKDINKFSGLPNLIQFKLDSIIKTYYHSYSNYLKFKIARKYDKELFKKRYNFNYDLPYVEAVYSLFIPNKITDTTEYLEYCVLISFDSTGNTIGQINLPSEEWQSKDILPKEKAVELSKKLWQKDKEEIYTKLAYDRKQNCFVWSMARQIEGRSKKGIYGRRQLIIINAYSGIIMENTKYYCNSNFL